MKHQIEASTDAQKKGLGAQLRQRRRIKNMTLSMLARQSSLSVGLLSQIERGLSSPSLKSLTQICATLGIPVSWLFDNGPPPDPVEQGSGGAPGLAPAP